MSRETDNSSRIVIIETKGQIIGILVDSVAEVVELRACEIENTANVGNDKTSRFIQGVTSQDNELLIIVDLDKFFCDEEKQGA